MSYLFEYWDLIRRKEVIVGYWIRKVVKNLIAKKWQLLLPWWTLQTDLL